MLRPVRAAAVAARAARDSVPQAPRFPAPDASALAPPALHPLIQQLIDLFCDDPDRQDAARDVILSGLLPSFPDDFVDAPALAIDRAVGELELNGVIHYKDVPRVLVATGSGWTARTRIVRDRVATAFKEFVPDAARVGARIAAVGGDPPDAAAVAAFCGQRRFFSEAEAARAFRAQPANAPGEPGAADEPGAGDELVGGEPVSGELGDGGESGSGDDPDGWGGSGPDGGSGGDGSGGDESGGGDPGPGGPDARDRPGLAADFGVGDSDVAYDSTSDDYDSDVQFQGRRPPPPGGHFQHQPEGLRRAGRRDRAHHRRHHRRSGAASDALHGDPGRGRRSSSRGRRDRAGWSALDDEMFLAQAAARGISAEALLGAGGFHPTTEQVDATLAAASAGDDARRRRAVDAVRHRLVDMLHEPAEVDADPRHDDNPRALLNEFGEAFAGLAIGTWPAFATKPSLRDPPPQAPPEFRDALSSGAGDHGVRAHAAQVVARFPFAVAAHLCAARGIAFDRVIAAHAARVLRAPGPVVGVILADAGTPFESALDAARVDTAVQAFANKCDGFVSFLDSRAASVASAASSAAAGPRPTKGTRAAGRGAARAGAAAAPASARAKRRRESSGQTATPDGWHATPCLNPQCTADHKDRHSWSNCWAPGGGREKAQRRGPGPAAPSSAAAPPPHGASGASATSSAPATAELAAVAALEDALRAVRAAAQPGATAKNF